LASFFASYEDRSDAGFVRGKLISSIPFSLQLKLVSRRIEA
jgi:hypothetical protein